MLSSRLRARERRRGRGRPHSSYSSYLRGAIGHVHNFAALRLGFAIFIRTSFIFLGFDSGGQKVRSERSPIAAELATWHTFPSFCYHSSRTLKFLSATGIKSCNRSFLFFTDQQYFCFHNTSQPWSIQGPFKSVGQVMMTKTKVLHDRCSLACTGLTTDPLPQSVLWAHDEHPFLLLFLVFFPCCAHGKTIKVGSN